LINVELAAGRSGEMVDGSGVAQAKNSKDRGQIKTTHRPEHLSLCRMTATAGLLLRCFGYFRVRADFSTEEIMKYVSFPSRPEPTIASWALQIDVGELHPN
jgi:hypothetical protein